MKKTTLLLGMVSLVALMFVLAGCATGEAKKIPRSCKDSDGGLNYYTAGSVQVTASKIAIYLDSCSSTDKYALKEYYCKGANAVSVKYKCPNGCLNSACIPDIIPPIQPPNQTTGNQTTTLTYTCTDSDGGKNYAVKGTAIVCGGTKCENHTDYCYEANTSVAEVFCSEISFVGGNGMSYSTLGYKCTNKCKDGACI
ncbi:MAG: hypothetical protein Q7J54_01725 [Candidatus Woesearchaeota archaeon]|nr:hypothetical protein [Candidatus Woesearchaeota archaeon]